MARSLVVRHNEVLGSILPDSSQSTCSAEDYREVLDAIVQCAITQKNVQKSLRMESDVIYSILYCKTLIPSLPRGRCPALSLQSPVL
jgi:hypothetical protein